MDDKNECLTPIWSALGKEPNGHPEVVVALVEAGVDVNQCRAYPRDCNTLLHVASQRGDAKMFSTLMACNASLTIKNKYGELPIDVAANDEIRQLINDEMAARFDHGLKRAVIPPPPPAAAELEQDIQPESGEGVGGTAGTTANTTATYVASEDEEEESEEDSSDEEDDN